MEWSILFAGPVGAGKTQAIRTISDIEVVSTEAAATDGVALLKENTTVAMDMGVLHLDGQDKVRLYGAPGQSRFDFMWDILLQQASGLVLLVDHSRPDPIADLDFYLSDLLDRMGHRPLPVVIGVTHMDLRKSADLKPYCDYLSHRAASALGGVAPVFEADARNARDVRTLLMTLTSMMDMVERFPTRSKPAALGYA
jgi:signal recognition particle receptor subunit beta